MKQVIALLVGVALLSGVSGAWAQEQQAQPTGNPGVVRTATITDLDGKTVQFQNVKFADTWRQNIDQNRIVKLVSDQLRYPDKPWNAKTNPFEPKCVEIYASDKSGNGLGRDAAVGFISNLPNAGGLIGAGALIRPNGTTQVNQGGNAQQSQGQRMKQQQQQNQNQVQVQNQNQTALGGAGGAGGSATITNTGGVGNVKTISNDANGNGTILGGNIF